MTAQKQTVIKQRKKNEEEDSPRLTLSISEKRDHYQGSSGAAVTVVEYGDYQCPFCGEAYPIVKRVQKKYGDKMRFVFRNFPITEAHPRAEFGAEMAEAAGAQARFWEMHDFLYEHQASLNDPQVFLRYAGEKPRIDSERINKEVSNQAYSPRIREDFMSGVRSGVNGTPTFFINDRRHNGSYEYSELVGAIESKLKKRSKQPNGNRN